jgi:tetratricopeptide (TPR) repeat protein
LRTERGALLGAYDLASDLVRRRPNSAEAFFALSYVLRYAGLLEESATACETALSLDPTEQILRSCGYIFQNLGDIARAKLFFALDGGSLWERTSLAYLHLDAGDLRKTLADFRQLPEAYFFWRAQGRVLEAFLEEPAALPAATQTAMELFATILDVETLAGGAGVFALTGQRAAALELLSRAVEGNFCAVFMAKDPTLSSLRNDKEFQRIYRDAVACQQKFLEHRGG